MSLFQESAGSTIHCHECGKAFRITNGMIKKYCSNNCAQEFKKKYPGASPNILPTIHCEECKHSGNAHDEIAGCLHEDKKTGKICPCENKKVTVEYRKWLKIPKKRPEVIGTVI